MAIHLEKIITLALKKGSDPVSFVLRPIFAHKRVNFGIGVVMAGLALIMGGVGPLPENAGGKFELMVVPEAEVSVVTTESAQVPVEKYRVSQGYHRFHPGVDLAAKIGEPVKPVSTGVVAVVKRDRINYGNHIVVDHENGERTLYAHLSKMNVVEGEKVTTETVIGEVGSTGRSTGPHLHLEIREDGKRVNPKSVLGL